MNAHLLGLIALTWLCIGRTSLANDSSMGGSGADLVPLARSDVHMLSEDILIVAADDDHWAITANYVFVNRSQQAARIQVGFPEYHCDSSLGGDCVAERPVDFKSLQTTIDGKPVKHRKGRVRSDHPWSLELGNVWVYDAVFPPDKTVHIAHSYRMLHGGNVSADHLGYYVTRTGAVWAGTIGKARFRVRVPISSNSIDTGNPAPPLQTTVHVIKEQGQLFGEIVYTAENWEPTADLFFSYRNTRHPYLDDMAPGYEAALKRANPQTGLHCTRFMDLREEGHLMQRSADVPTAEQVNDFVKTGIGDARTCRNLLFALHGKRFKRPALNRQFYGPAGFEPGTFPFEAFEPNPYFNNSMLSRGDWNTLKLIETIVANPNGL